MDVTYTDEKNPHELAISIHQKFVRAPKSKTQKYGK